MIKTDNISHELDKHNYKKTKKESKKFDTQRI